MVSPSVWVTASTYSKQCGWLAGMETPDRKINVRDPDHCPHAFRDRIALPMPEQATHKGRYFVLGHCQGDEAIPGMAKMTRIKVLISGQKRRAS